MCHVWRTHHFAKPPSHYCQHNSNMVIDITSNTTSQAIASFNSSVEYDDVSGVDNDNVPPLYLQRGMKARRLHQSFMFVEASCFNSMMIGITSNIVSQAVIFLDSGVDNDDVSPLA